MIGHFEEKNRNKYFVLKEIETINGGEKIEYGKDF